MVKIFSFKLNKTYNLKNLLSDENRERTINNAGTVNSVGEFKYIDGGVVPEGTPYHIQYSRIGKLEIYMTGKELDETSVVINRIKGLTSIGKYINITNKTDSMIYLKPFKFKVTKKHRKIGNARRYFAQQANNIKAPVIEISKFGFDKSTPFYKKYQMKWSLNIDRQMMIDKNINAIDKAVKEGFSSLKSSLNPAQGYVEDVETSQIEKVKKLKKLLS